MSITVRQLVETPHLRTRFVAGQAGAEQVINWAHSCELDKPWDWLEAFDLLMTNGLGIPKLPVAQAAYIERLADAGISGIAIAEPAAPAISAEMTAAAERRALPILLTAYEVSFAALARAVAESKGSHQERVRLARTARIYECVRAAAAEGNTAAELMRNLGKELGCRLAILDTRAWRYALDPARTAEAATHEILSETLRSHDGHLPAIMRLEIDGQAAVVVPIPSRRPAALVACGFETAMPELTVLQHVSTVAAMELEKLLSQREQRHSHGAELLGDLIAERISAAEATVRLARAGLPTARLVVVAWHHDRDDPGYGDVHQGLYARNIEHLLRIHDRLATALMPAGDQATEALLAVLPEAAHVGVSAEVASLDRISHAGREARWALWSSSRADSQRSRVNRYGDAGSVAMPVNLGQADDLVEHVLGPLLRYDAAHRSELIRTLAVLLRHNRSATPAAAELRIHRQTLLYRVHRIEELTSRSLGRLGDVVELWLALRALEVVDGRILLGP